MLLNWTDEQYFSDREYVRKGWLDKITLQAGMGGSPAKLKSYLMGEPERKTAAMEFGSAFHAMVLEGKQAHPINASRRGTKAYEGELAMIKARCPDDIALPVKDYDRAMRMVAALNTAETEAAEFARYLLKSPGLNEEVFHGPIQTEPFNGHLSEAVSEGLNFDKSLHGELHDVKCKAKIDRLCIDPSSVGTDLAIVDLKTSADASPEEFARSCAKYRYVYQQAYYSAVFRSWVNNHADTGDLPFELPPLIDNIRCYFIVVQSDYSGIVATYECDIADLAREDDQVVDDLGVYGLCMKENNWPPAASKPTVLSLPHWYRRNNG